MSAAADEGEDKLQAGQVGAPDHWTNTGVELFRSENLLVRRVAMAGGPYCVVTFDSFNDAHTLDRPGFGEIFFKIKEMDAVHVLSRDNDWYHYPEMADAMACVHAATRGYERVTTYGSSMGAYAAIRFAGLAGANAVLALSPQFSIAPSTVPWETRWLEHGRGFNPRWEKSLPLPSVADACVVYDPTDLDGRHIAALARVFRFEGMPLPVTGHPVTGCLSEIRLLHDLVVEMACGRLDKAAFRLAILDRVPTSSHYLTTVAKRMPPWRRARRLALMRQAVTVAPKDPYVYRCLGIELRKAGQLAESLAMHGRALELFPGNANLRLEYSLTLAASGELARGIAMVEDIHRRAGQPIYQSHLDGMNDRLAGGVAAAMRRLRRWIRPVRPAIVSAVMTFFPATTRASRGNVTERAASSPPDNLG